MAKHKRDMSAFNMRDAPPLLRFSPTSLRMRPRSPSKSPSRHSRSPTRSRITDDIFEDLSPARILERFTSASGELAKSIEASSPDQKQFGIRAAVASKKIEEWANEVGGWPWPSNGADGFVMPENTYGIFGERKDGVTGSDGQVDTEEYWGSLSAPLIELYSSRVSEIFDDMFDLDIEEIKNKVLDLVATDAQPASLAGDASLPTTPLKSKFTRLDTFTGMITHTVLDALPKLHRLRKLLDVWSIRIDILRDVPPTLMSLREAYTMLQSAWVSLKATNASGENMILTHSDYTTMQLALGETISDAGKKIDSMLDRLDGRVDTVPGPWLDRMDAVETEYGNWTVAAERMVLEGEWAIKAAKKAEMKKLLRESGVEHSDIGLEEEALIEGTATSNEEWTEKVPIEHITTPDEGSIKNTTSEDIRISENGRESVNPPSVEPGTSNDKPHIATEHSAPPSEPAKPLQAPLEIQWPVNDETFNIPWGFDGQDDRLSPATLATDNLSHQGGSSPSPSARHVVAGSRTQLIASLQTSERSFYMGSSRSPSVQERSTPPRLPLPYRIYSENSQPNSPELYPPLPRSPSPTGSVNFRPFILNSSSAIGSRPPSPSLPLGRRSRNSVVAENWNIGEAENYGTNNRISRRDSQASPTSPIFPSFRGGSPLFPGSRSSSVSLRPSRSKRRSETIFGDVNELALSAAASDYASQESNTTPIEMGRTESEPPSSPTKQTQQNESATINSQSLTYVSASDPFTDVPRLSPTPATQAGSPHTPPQMSASSTMHAIMSPSNQPAPTRYHSDDNYPMSPSKKIVLDDGGTPRSPKKNKQALKEQRLSSSVSDDDNESLQDSANKSELQPAWPGLQSPPPKFELRSPWTRSTSSQSASTSKRGSIAGLDDETEHQNTLETSTIPVQQASVLSGEPGSGSVEPGPTDQITQVVVDDITNTQGQGNKGFLSAVPHTPTEMEHTHFDTTPNAHDEAIPILSKDTLTDYQVDGCRSHDLDNSRRGSIVSLSSSDTVFKASSASASKLPVFDTNVALESPRIIEDLASDDGYDLDFSPSTRRTILFSNSEIHQSIEEDYSEPNTPVFSVAPTLYSYTTEDTEADPSVSGTLESVDKLALEAPSFSNVEIDLKLPQLSPAKISDDQLQQQISEILESIPAKIELSNAPIPSQKSPMKLKHTIKKRPSRASLSPALRPTYSRAATPSFTLAPAKSRLSRPRQQSNSDIQLYHLMRSTDEAPIKLFVRLVGEAGERVMVRVGGGWADLGEYLKEYSSHHGRRAERGGEIKVELPSNTVRPRMGSIGSVNPAPGMLRTGPNGNVWSSPASRPGSSMGTRPGSSLQVRKRGTRVSDIADTKENSMRSPSTPLPFTSNTLRTNAAGGQTPPARSVSRQAWSVGPDGEEVLLGPSGPKNKKGELDEGRKRWVDGVVEKVRQVSVENSKDAFGVMGQVGGTKRVFRKGG